jgi:beta-lactamase superfamily II metal-dependent hydrolase
MSIIKSFSVGNGDMFYIDHNSDNFTIIDCNLPEDKREDMLSELSAKCFKVNIVTRVISTHPDEDHLFGLTALDDKLKILNFYCPSNEATKPDKSEDFVRYCELRDSTKAFHIYKGCTRKWMNESDDQRGSSGINILWPDTSNTDYKEALEAAKSGNSPNNISPIIQYAIENGPKFLWMGDLETDFMEKIESKVSFSDVHILFAPHHGRDSGKVPASILQKILPKIIIIGEAPTQHLNYYSGYDTITQNSAGDIIFDAKSDFIDIYVSNTNYSVTFLTNRNLSDTYGKYIGSLKI